MKFIKRETKLVLAELDKVEQWEDGFLSIRHQSGFEIFQPRDPFFIRLWNQPIKWNLIEKFLVWRKARQIKESFMKPYSGRYGYELHSFFKS